MKNIYKNYIFITVLALLIGVTLYSSYQIFDNSEKKKELKSDYSVVNDILYGVLSVDRWESEIRNIAEQQIKDFELTEEQDSIIRVQIRETLHALIKEGDDSMQENDNSVGEFFEKLFYNIFVDVEDFHKKVPRLTDAIMIEITSEESKERLRILINSKINELAAQTYDSLNTVNISHRIMEYGVTSKEDFNHKIESDIKHFEEETKYYAITIFAIMILFLAIWYLPALTYDFRKILIVLSVILAVIVLITGIITPMIEIDARLKDIDYLILGEHITFKDQMIFHKSKSIMEIVSILLTTGKIDSFFVGFLILSFSILFPIAKLISMVMYLFINRIRNNRFVNWIAFYSGKWSMADVMVVAIFMAYIAFDGILKNQLSALNRSTETLTAVTSNNSGLDVGLYLFLVYVLFSIILSGFLMKFIKKDEAAE